MQDWSSAADPGELQEPRDAIYDNGQRDDDQQVGRRLFELEPFKVEGKEKAQSADTDDAENDAHPHVAFELEKAVGHPIAPGDRPRNTAEAGYS